MIEFEEAIPNSEFLIKSISEQGYSLETAITTLINNDLKTFREQ